MMERVPLSENSVVVSLRPERRRKSLTGELAWKSPGRLIVEAWVNGLARRKQHEKTFF